MLDFLEVSTRSSKKDVIEVYPKFKIESKLTDLMIRGRDFYAIWNDDEKLWSTDEGDVVRQVDKEIFAKAEQLKKEMNGQKIVPMLMKDSDSGVIDKWHRYVQKQMRDCYHPLDEKIIFSDSETKKRDYASKKLGYPFEETSINSYDELMKELYDPDERDKLEWAIGAIISGDSKKIQKFIVLYGTAGSGKSTFLNILQMLFEGYYSIFDARELASSNNSFALESFKSNPLVSIQHDGDLSKIEDNTKLNSIVSHETMEINEKFKNKYSAKFNTFLFMGTNKPVKITEAKSGIIRRLIDVRPSGRKIDFDRYTELMNHIPFELSGIAWHCLKKYEEMGQKYYDKYVPTDMIAATNDFYNFVENNYDTFKEEDGVSLKAAWALYKEYCDYANIQFPFSMKQLRLELKNYFSSYEEQAWIKGNHIRNYYSGFLKDKFTYEHKPEKKKQYTGWLNFDSVESIFDSGYEGCLAQYANDSGTPTVKWSSCKTKLSDIDTSKLHYVRVPENHIVIDFDLKDENGNKDFKRNLEAALKWPKTYAELSKSGQGIHLHYIYSGDISKLSRVYDENIEVKIFNGNSSLRRKLTKCNNLEIAIINSGLPLKGGKDMINFEAVKSEKELRRRIKKCLNKEHHGATKPEVDFIFKILNDAYDNKTLSYDVTDLRPSILAFANNSTNNAEYCVKLVSKMQFKSDEPSIPVDNYGDAPIIFVDVEVFINLFVVCWKMHGKDKSVVKMINPKPIDIEGLLKYRIVGFNNRRYDNHILYARLMNYGNKELFDLSQRIINGSKNAMFGEAYNLSYTDVLDFCSEKKSLKKWEIDLGIHHKELGLPWDQPVPEELWDTVADYCSNDVIATEAVFDARQADFKGREILVDLANILVGPGHTVNDTTNSLTTALIVGNAKDPQKEFVYPDLAKEFPGYEYCPTGIDKDRYISKDVIISGKSFYKGYDPGEGGFVYARHGIYSRSESLDSASHHPKSLIAENGFGPFTDNFKRLLDIRLLIKHKEYDEVKKMFNGALAKYLTTKEDAKALSYALKIAINSVYGLTSAHFDNKLRDPRNIDNWVAKRGALFMIDLMLEVEKQGYTVIHVKTDSIKIDKPDDYIRNFVFEYAKKYGYTFEVEHKFDRICLVNDAVYVCKFSDDDPENPGAWDATGAQFDQPYVFKTLFSKEPIEFRDMCETKTVTTALYLDMNEGLGEDEHNYVFVGKAGSFCPIKEGCGGGILLRQGNDGKYSAATGTKGYRWLESEVVKNFGKEEDIDKSYYISLVDKAIQTISKFGDYEWFVSGEPEKIPDWMNPPENPDSDAVPF